jgi:hypothetical protein
MERHWYQGSEMAFFIKLYKKYDTLNDHLLMCKPLIILYITLWQDN